jgi:hypothetical protein
MASPRSTIRPRPPHAWQRVLYYANGTPTADNWTAFLLGTRHLVPIRETFGIKTLDELRAVLDPFRHVLGNLVSSSIPYVEQSVILDVINERAKGVLHEWTWLRGSGRVFPQIRTQTLSFEESLYAQLAMALTVAPFTHVKQCRVCRRFFYEPRRRVARFCHAKCREDDAKQRVARYRAAHPEKYREYQRRLMARRRREGTA